MKLAAYTADSVKLASQRRRIDSLRHETRGVPVVVDGDTLFYFYAKRGGHTPQQRAENVANDITALGKRFNLKPDSVYIETSDIVTDVMYDNKVLVSFYRPGRLVGKLYTRPAGCEESVGHYRKIESDEGGTWTDYPFGGKASVMTCRGGWSTNF